MIDKKTGKVQFPEWDFSLSPSVTRSEFLKSNLGQNAKPEVLNEPYASWRINPSPLYDKWWTVVAYFNGERLYSITLAAWNDEDGPKWSDWSDAGERKLEKYHSSVLAKIFGRTPYKFSWGTVESFYDKRSASAHIHIGYNEL
jgi:hypothetical protein